MNVKIEAIHFNPDSKLEEFITEKVGKLSQVADDIIKAEVFLSLERSQSKNYDSKTAKIRIEVPGSAIFAEKKYCSFFVNALNSSLSASLITSCSAADIRRW